MNYVTAESRSWSQGSPWQCWSDLYGACAFTDLFLPHLFAYTTTPGPANGHVINVECSDTCIHKSPFGGLKSLKQ